MRRFSFAACVAKLAIASGVVVADDSSAANPIRKVVTMLQKMKTRVEEEAKKDEALNKKYTCYCKTSGNELDEAIAASTAKIPEVESALAENAQKKKQLDADLESARNDRTAAKNAISSATSIREKEAATFEAEKSEADANIGALAKAIVAIENGMSGGFLQTTSAQILRELVRKAHIFDEDTRQELTSFLSASQYAGYSPKSGEIVGILKGIKEEMEKNLSESTASEKSSASEYGALMNAKKKEIAALTKSIETKTLRIGEIAVSIANMKNDLSDTQAALLDNKQFSADLEANCGARAKEWEVITKTRSEELVALSETIKILNDDDALELFKKTLPSASASFVQMRSRSSKAKEHAYKILKSAQDMQTFRGDSFDLIMLALRGKKIGFEQVIKMIDSMVNELKAEQTEDENKKEYCGTQLDSSDDKRKSLEQDVEDADTVIADTKEKLSTIESEIKSMLASIAELDKLVAEASEQRKDEHEAYLELVSSNAAATELLGFAKNRLQKFYNPKLHVPETAFVQVSTHIHEHVAAQPAPESVGPYKKSQESSGVIAMIDLLIKDLTKETTEAEAEEKNAQSDFEGTLKDATQKRAADTKTLEGKKSSKADVEVFLDNSETGRTSSVKELAATTKVIAMLHSECDWLLKYFDTRKDARSSEVDALVQAKAVLNGADYSFLQTTSKLLKDTPENQLAKEMTHDLEMNFNKIAPFGKEDTAKELQDHAAKTQNTLVDAVENAEVAEIKRAVFRALTRLRAATIKEFDTIARLETQAIDAYNDAHHYRAENPLAHLHEDEAPVETDKLKSFH
jgi:hypothetical protein